MEVNKEDYDLNYPLSYSFSNEVNNEVNYELNDQLNNQLNSQLISEKSVKEHFNNRKVGWTTYGIIHFLAFIFAVYLAFKCNPNISILSVLVAIFCPWIYIIYILVTRKGICSNVSPNNPMEVKLV